VQHFHSNVFAEYKKKREKNNNPTLSLSLLYIHSVASIKFDIQPIVVGDERDAIVRVRNSPVQSISAPLSLSPKQQQQQHSGKYILYARHSDAAGAFSRLASCCVLNEEKRRAIVATVY
jgi:hypothetical protein